MNSISVRRQEYKYFINNADIAVIRGLIQNTMILDNYADSDTRHYRVTSLYFDSFDDSDLDEKLDGILDRKKYRIRIYNDNSSTVKLEVKKKNGTVISKDSTLITQQSADCLINGRSEQIREKNNVINLLIAKIKSDGYRPKVIVEYDREAYFLPYGDIRLTFDKNLRTYNFQHNIFDLSKSSSLPVFLDNMQIMELKFSIPLPEYISKALSTVSLTRCSISKYVMCQRFSDGSKWRDELGAPF